MPSPVRIAALIAILALLVPSAALAQSDGDGGAGDSQYEDPFGTQTQSTPSTPSQQQQPAQQQRSSPQPTPDHTDAAPGATAPAAQAQQTQSGQELPRTGFDVLPVAVVGLLLVLGGLALRRRPHGER
jgi:LPXTG-motif cell wall-anchored protein